MNDDRLIEQIARLKNVRPTGEAAARLKNRVFSGVRAAAALPADFRHGRMRAAARIIARPAAAYPVGILALLFIALTQGSALAGMAHHAYLEERLALASNDYDKAQRSLDLAKQELADFQDAGGGSAGQIAHLADASAQADQYMNRLSLVGEAGKYSSAQCLEAYQEYEQYLSALQAAAEHASAVASNASAATELSSLRRAAAAYQHAANTRLEQYRQHDL